MLTKTKEKKDGSDSESGSDPEQTTPESQKADPIARHGNGRVLIRNGTAVSNEPGESFTLGASERPLGVMIRMETQTTIES